MSDQRDTSEERRKRLAEAVASSTGKRGEEITLDELATIWGVGKPAFVNLRNRIRDFPPPRIDGKKHLYHRLKALKALDTHERRGDAEAEAKRGRLAALLGVEPEQAALPISDLQKAYNLRLEMQAAAVAQGNLVPKQQVQSSASKVFEIMSRALSDLGAVIDPNGQHSPEIRESLDTAGKALLLRIHAELKDMLSPDAPRTSQPHRDRKRDAGAGAHGARRQR